MNLDYLVILILLTIIITCTLVGLKKSLLLFISLLISFAFPIVIIKMFTKLLNISIFNKIGKIVFDVFKFFTDLKFENAKLFFVLLVGAIILYLIVRLVLSVFDRNKFKSIKKDLSKSSMGLGGVFGIFNGFMISFYITILMTLLYPVDNTTFILKQFTKIIEILRIL